MTAIPSWFGPPPRPLFAWMHVPAGNRATGAVVLCPPLALELVSTQSCYRLLAEQLAENGMLAIRFDYDGTGDSAGGDEDPSRVESWLASIGHAVDLARSCGATSVSLVGMRMGALLAAAATARLGSIDALVLWDPCPSGRSFVRAQAALESLHAEGGSRGHQVGDATELPGFVFSAQTVSDLSALSVPDDRVSPSRLLVLTRPGRRSATELADALGTDPDTGEALGQDRLLEVAPAHRQSPHETMDHIVSWLADTDRAPVSISVPNRTQASMLFEGTVLTERAVRLGPSALFGIETEPETPIEAPTVLMLNAGTDWHVGPNRLWVDLSRRWAAAGIRCIRIDESGIGDSSPRPGRATNVVRAPEAFDDLREARAAVSPEDPTNVVLVGLCSGGYQGLEDALIQPTRGVYAINPVLHFAPPEMATGSMDPRRRICWPVSNFALTYRSLPLTRVQRRLRKVLWRAVHFFNRDRDRDPSNWLDQLRTNGVEVMVVCGEDEARPFGSASVPRSVDGLAGHDPIRIDVIPGLDGALMPAWQRAEVTRRMTDHLLERFSSWHAESAAGRATV